MNPINHMTLDQARKIIEEIHERYGIQFSETQENRENGQIRTIYVTLKFKLDSAVGAYLNMHVKKNIDPDGVALRQPSGHSTGREK